MNENTNIKILSVTPETITIEVNGQEQSIANTYQALQQLLSQNKAHSFQSADKLYNINSIGEANFYVVMDRLEAHKILPEGLAENIITSDNIWIDSLKEELQEQPNISVGNKAGSIFHHYGWLIETFLLKMASKVALEDKQRRLSFMTEAYQSSLRFLTYIQLAQLLSKPTADIRLDFFQLEAEQFDQYDFLNLLWQASKQVESAEYFVTEMEDFLENLFDKESELYEAVIFLEQYRTALITDSIPEGKDMQQLLDEYLTALVYWLRYISFLAQYRLVSIKDVNLNYQLGTVQQFVHTYGELHGMYDESASDFNTRTLEEVFTYSRSVLLFKGSSIEAGLDKITATSTDKTNYLSLSPLIIDQSVYRDKETQTPEIYYYVGKGKRQYCYAQYRNELLYGEERAKKSNKYINIKKQNTKQPKWNKLYKQIDRIFEAFKTAAL